MNSISAPTSSSSTTLKRTRSAHNTWTLNTTFRPLLPKITGEHILQVFTHKSLRRSADSAQDECGDNERLSELGEKVLEAVVTHNLFTQRPMLKAIDISTQRDEVLSDANIEDWVKMYGMREKLRCHPDVFPSLNTPKETRSIFNSYVGGVYMECGIETVQEWINRLLGKDHDLTPEPESASPHRPETPPNKKVKGEPRTPTAQSPTIFFASQPPPSPMRHPPPHLHPPPSLPNPLAPAQPSLPFLPLFNQTATQRRVTVEYPAEFSGPSHAGRWTVQCVVNGISKGVGTGGSKQVAKEEAARQAYYAMGWT